MKHIRKQLAILLSLAMLVSMMGLAGCGSKDAGNADPAANAGMDASGNASGDASGTPMMGGGGGAGSAGQEFGTFAEVQSFAGALVDGSNVSLVSDYNGTIEGEITADGMDGVKINVTEGNGIAISKDSESDTFKIRNSEINATSGEINNTLGYEAAAGVAIGVETGELWIENSTITSDGPRSTPVYLFSTNSPEATSLVVVDSTLKAHSADIWMPPFKLLAGGARATLLMTRNNSWFYGADVLSNNWGAISQDSVDATTYVVNSSGIATEGGYATYLTYGMRLYGSQLYGGQYGVFMCGTSDILTDKGAAALADKDAMSKVPDYEVEDSTSIVAAPFNAVVVHNSLPDTSMVAVGNFKNSILSTELADLPEEVTPMAADDDFFLPGVDIIGSGAGCGASYFYSKNLYGSAVLVRSMNADFTFDNTTVKTSNGVLVQSVVTYDPPHASGYLAVGEGEKVAGVSASFLNGDYEGDILAQDYQRKMTVTIGENAKVTGKIVSGTYAAWNNLWSTDNLLAMLQEDNLEQTIFNNEIWDEDVRTNLILADDEAYNTTENLGVDLTVTAGGTWVVTGNSSLSSLTLEEGAKIQAPAGKTMTVYEKCDAGNAYDFYNYDKATEVSELTAGSYANVVIVVE